MSVMHLIKWQEQFGVQLFRVICKIIVLGKCSDQSQVILVNKYLLSCG